MKRVFIILIATLGLCLSASAQNIRLGEKIPEISVTSDYGDDLQLIDKEYTCLIFMHSQCEPCINALPSLHSTTAPYSDALAVVLLTNESSDKRDELTTKFGSYVTTIAFDNSSHTYRAFGINFVPFAVIYNTKSHRIEWFGSIQQLDSKQISNLKKID